MAEVSTHPFFFPLIIKISCHTYPRNKKAFDREMVDRKIEKLNCIRTKAAVCTRSINA
jgi:hypothetical protein